MESKSRAKSQYFLITQSSIKNAPNQILVCVREHEWEEWLQFKDNNEKCGVSVTYEETNLVSLKKTFEIFVDGLTKDNAEKQALSSLTHDQLVELALQTGVTVPKNVVKLNISDGF